MIADIEPMIDGPTFVCGGEYCEWCWDFDAWKPRPPISNCPLCMKREWPDRCCQPDPAQVAADD